MSLKISKLEDLRENIQCLLTVGANFASTVPTRVRAHLVNIRANLDTYCGHLQIGYTHVYYSQINTCPLIVVWFLWQYLVYLEERQNHVLT